MATESPFLRTLEKQFVFLRTLHGAPHMKSCLIPLTQSGKYVAL